MKTNRKGGATKIGDWVLHDDGRVGQVAFVDGNRLTVGDAGWYEWNCKRLPASPAEMAKSHRLLMRWAKSAGFVPLYVDNHLSKIARTTGRPEGRKS